MNRYTVSFSEMNSGGYYVLGRVEYSLLEEAGWEYEGTYVRGDGLPRYWFKSVTAPDEHSAYESTIREWERITGEDRYAMSCSCCGNNYDFDIDKDEYTYEDEFNDAIQEALNGGLTEHDLLSMVAQAGRDYPG